VAFLEAAPLQAVSANHADAIEETLNGLGPDRLQSGLVGGRPATVRVAMLGWRFAMNDQSLDGSPAVDSERPPLEFRNMTTLVQLLSVPTCQVCDITVETMRHLAAEYPVMTIERLNVADQVEILERYGLLSFEYDVLDTHAVVIGDRLAGTGHPSEDTLRSWFDQALIDVGIFDESVGKVDPPED
jgi:hypothetical protein